MIHYNASHVKTPYQPDNRHYRVSTDLNAKYSNHTLTKQLSPHLVLTVTTPQVMLITYSHGINILLITD